MSCCPNCSGDLADIASVERCPYCNEQLGDSATDADRSTRLTPLFRFGNAAEAGYFAHELQAQSSVSARIISVDNFDAVSGYWATRFVLAVPEVQATMARQALRSILEGHDAEAVSSHAGKPLSASERYSEYGIDTGGETSAFDHPAFGHEDQDSVPLGRQVEFESTQFADESGVHWMPIVLTLAAGSAVFFWSRKAPDAAAPPAAIPAKHQQGELWQYLSEDETPWEQSINNGRGRRVLVRSKKSDEMLIREDWDGDGIFEKEHAFRRESFSGL